MTFQDIAEDTRRAMLNACWEGVVGDTDSNNGQMARLALLLAGVVVTGLAVFRFMGEPDAAPPEPEPELPRSQAAAPAREPARAGAGDAGPDPYHDAPLATQPRPDEPWGLLRVPLVCTIEPPVAGAAVKGKAHPVTWPGPDHEPQEGGPPHPSIPYTVTIDGGVLTSKTSLPAVDAGDAPLRHIARLVVPGFAPTEFSFITSGPDQPAVCAGPIQLEAAASGVVGTVRRSDGSPAEGAIVAGCGARAVAGGDGAYFLLPRAAERCALRARHAPGSVAQTDPQQVDPLADEDPVVDFVVDVPERPSPGVEIFRTDDDEVWARPDDPDVPWASELHFGARILRVGDTPAHELSDDELWRAMVHLDQPVQVQQTFETEDGQSVRSNVTVSEL